MSVFDVLTAVPTRLVAGDSVTFARADLGATYPAASYGMAFVASPESGGDVVTVAGVDFAGAWSFTITSAVSADLTVGVYRWALVVTRISDGAKVTMEDGALDVIAGAAAGVDRRSADVRLIDMIDAVLESRVTKDVESYTIEGRSVTKIPVAELRAMRNAAVRRVRAASGKSAITFMKVR